MPPSTGVAGEKPTSRTKSSTSAEVAAASPGCMGKRFSTALRPSWSSMAATKSMSSTGLLLPML